MKTEFIQLNAMGPPLRGLALLFNALASAQTKGPADLWIRDDVNDRGDEPNTLTTAFYISDDIWVRRLPDPNYDPHPFPSASLTWSPLPHEGPCYGTWAIKPGRQ